MTQREMAEALGLALGKTHYSLKALVDAGRAFRAVGSEAGVSVCADACGCGRTGEAGGSAA